MKPSDAISTLRAVQRSLPQQFADTKQQILHWSPDMPCKVSEGCGTERTKIRQVLKQPHPFNILPFKNNLSLCHQRYRGAAPGGGGCLVGLWELLPTPEGAET